jgi:hypothetical protein
MAAARGGKFTNREKPHGNQEIQEEFGEGQEDRSNQAVESRSALTLPFPVGSACWAGNCGTGKKVGN